MLTSGGLKRIYKNSLFYSFCFFFLSVWSYFKINTWRLMGSINMAQELALGGHSCGRLSLRRNKEMFREKRKRVSSETMQVAFTLRPSEHHGLHRKSKAQRPSSGSSPRRCKDVLPDSMCQQMTVTWIDELRKSLFLKAPWDSRSQAMIS